MELFLNQSLNGIGRGVIYASVALALVLIFRTTGLLNFAQGEMALFSAYLTVKLFDQGLPPALAIAGSVVISFVGGAVIERTLIRPVEQSRSPLNVVIVTLGMFLAINALAQLAFGTEPLQFPQPWPSVPGANRAELVGIAGLTISWSTIALTLALVGECLFLYLLLQKTKVGLALRAVSSNPDSSRLVGINTGVMLMLGWALSAGIGALAGSFVAASAGAVDASLMQSVLVYAFAAAALGGFDSPLGAVVGGLIVGIADALTVQYIDALDGISIVVPLLLIGIVLVVRPTGLFGRPTVERL